VVALLPTIGLSTADSIRILHDVWDLDRPRAAARLGATLGDMREAGCTPAELLATHPRQILGTLDTSPDTWTRAAVTMIEHGYPPVTVARHLTNYAPNPDVFALAMTAIVEDPADGFAYCARRSDPDQLARLGQHYGLTPHELAAVLDSAGADPATILDTITLAVDGDTALADSIYPTEPVTSTELVETGTGRGDSSAAVMVGSNIDDLRATLLTMPSSGKDLSNDRLLAAALRLVPDLDHPGPELTQ
jgi:hypothetical protein